MRSPPSNLFQWNREPGVFEWYAGKVRFPHGFHYERDASCDSDQGRFTSFLHSAVVFHDIGSYAGAFANPRSSDFFQESTVNGFRVRIAMRAQTYPNSPKHFFAVTFPDSGCANFFFASNDPADAALIHQIAKSYQPKGSPSRPHSYCK